MLPTPAYCPLWKDVTSRWRVMLYINYLGVLLYGRHTSPLLAYSITSIGMDSWIFSFILCFITQHYIIYFVAQIVCVFHCLIPGTTTRARLSPPLESAVSPRSSGFFSQRMMLETKTWMCPLLLGYTCFWALSGDRASHVPSHIASTISQFSSVSISPPHPFH